jgi:shikimate dehydrogenase
MQSIRYGLIGYPLSHSFSGTYFAAKFEKEKITNCRYDLFPIKSIGELPELLSTTPELAGLNVTIPYKEQVLPFLHHRSEAVAEIGACNCIRIQNGKLEGHNTDVIGFEAILQPLLKAHHQHALILGTGGAAKAVAWVLKKKAIDFRYVSRTTDGQHQLSYADCTPSFLSSQFLIINTTPLGMYPETEVAPKLPYEAIGKNHLLIDLIYNPARTLFLRKGEERGATVENGLRMLEIQAEESWRIWQNDGDD